MPQTGRELRRHPRRKVSADGNITFADGCKLICRIKDISESGALLMLSNEIEMPFDFTLEFGNNGTVRRTCYVVRQDGRRVGVRFPNR